MGRLLKLLDLTSYFLDSKHRLTTAPLTTSFFYTWEVSILFNIPLIFSFNSYFIQLILLKFVLD